LIIIGVVLIILTPIWKWGLGPTLVKIPDDIDITSVYEGTLTLNVDPTSMQVLPAGMEVKIPLTITRKDVSEPEKSSSSVAVVKEVVDAKGPGGKTFLTWTRYYAMDRKTGENVAGNNSDMDRTGYFLLLSFNVEKKTYPFFDDDAGKTGDAKFVKVEKRDGFKYKDTNVYVFEISGSDVIKKAPLGLPDKIPGKDIKAIINNPNAPFNDDELYKIDYIKSTVATIVADQKTGTIVDIPAYQEEYFVDATALGQGKIKLATLKYRQTLESVHAVVDDAAKYYSLLDMVDVWIPIILLVLGLVVLAIGLGLYLRKPSA
jgi:hypothetical protein